MTKVTVDAELRARLNGLRDPLELCDEAGQTVGHFLPPSAYRDMLYAWANAQVDEDELERASREPGGRSLQEIWQSLGQR